MHKDGPAAVQRVVDEVSALREDGNKILILTVSSLSRSKDPIYSRLNR